MRSRTAGADVTRGRATSGAQEGRWKAHTLSVGRQTPERGEADARRGEGGRPRRGARGGRGRGCWSEAGSGFAALMVIGAPSQDKVPAPEDVHRSSTDSASSTYRLPISVPESGPPGDG